MTVGTAWVVTGYSVVGGTLFLFGFLFFYNINPVTIPTTTLPTTTTASETTSPIILSSIMTSIQTTNTTSTTTMATTAMATTESQVFQCGEPGNSVTPRIAEPLIDQFLASLLEQRIIGGTTATLGEWPWIAYLYELQNGPVAGGFCGGTLVSEKWVITAAHCIVTNDPLLYGVILGAVTISTPSGLEEDREVSNIVIHPDYDPISFNFDIALLELSEPVQFNIFIRPACIVPPGTRTDDIGDPSFAGSVCSTLGWGFTSSPGGQRSDTLMQLNLFISPETVCTFATLSNAEDYGNRPVFAGDPKFCAGGRADEDTCDGDSGGPLVCQHQDGMFYLHGITSYGTTICAQPGKPGVYTDIANDNILQFINETIFS